MDGSERIDECRAIQKRTGRTFYLATLALPRRVRHATYVLYAFFRTADDVVDDAESRPAAEKRAELDRLRAAALDGRATDDPVLSAFQTLRKQYPIDDEDVEAFLSAMERDVITSRYATYADLEGYMRGSAVAVAYMMLDVMGSKMPEAARPHARALGQAFQMTNFLRDVAEDIREYDRIYVPERTLDRYGVTEEDVRRGRADDGFEEAVRTELLRTERLYREGVAGIRYLPRDCRFAVLAASVLYAEYHRRIRRQNYDVLTREPDLSTARKGYLLAKTWWRWRRTGDPEATFYAVSDVPDAADGRERTTPGVVGDV